MADLIHLKLTNIKGESTSARHRDEIALESWNWDLSTGGPMGGSAGGAAAARPVFSPFSWAHRVDIASPLPWKTCATGQHIADALLSIARPLATAGDYLTLHMTNVLIASVGLADVSSDAQPPLESVAMTFATFEYSYRPQLANGSFGPAVPSSTTSRQNRVLSRGKRRHQR
jgi:type VI secretion system secreted protein Hcp